jgi:hypothetical protein
MKDDLQRLNDRIAALEYERADAIRVHQDLLNNAEGKLKRALDLMETVRTNWWDGPWDGMEAFLKENGR